MQKVINSELLQVAIRKASKGQNLAVVGAVNEEAPTCHVLVFHASSAEAIEKALNAAGIDWLQVQVGQSDFYEPRDPFYWSKP